MKLLHIRWPQKSHFLSVEAQNTPALDQSVLLGIDFRYYKHHSPHLILCIKLKWKQELYLEAKKLVEWSSKNC